MTDSQFIDPAQTRAKNDRWTQFLHLAAYPAAIFSGFKYGITNIRDIMYVKIKKHGGFNHFRPEYEKNFRELVNGTGNPSTIPTSIDILQQQYWQKVNEHMEKIGLRSTPDFWRALHKNEQREIMFNGAGLAAVMLGVTLTILESGEILRKINERKAARSAEK